ncbi:hypothetical protein [Burkholderia gladioli]|uniref:hypothetical protein n=1 Tax=Burkholderia gladioli TaxID=28095 RepID=UPI000FDA121F|nr:hypothetical protein [Burkholderia gladioli]MBU9427282.1 hypothetical protein [Burkholderia gladioli]MDN8064355.1 hypothetical protein [Burkholderia gladioli]QPQ82976.1 hypothetical protein I6H08_17120 [Burkholderia gladioli]
MLKKLEIDVLMADLASVEAMLASRTEEEDPSGYYQFSARKAQLEEAIARVGDRPETHAELGIFFGGGPVQGSRGINADFAGKALDDLQTLVSKKYSSKEVGPLGARGPVPRADTSQLLITGVARGSFGFVLEESGVDGEIVNTPLKETVDEITDILSRVGAADEAVFDEAASELDERTLVTLKQFFQRLDDSGATMRVVDGSRDFLLDRNAVSIARQRTQAMEIEERGEELIGTLFLLPNSHRFEFNPTDGRAVMKGTFGSNVVRQLEGQAELGQVAIDAREIPRRPWRVEIRTREIRERNRAPRQVFTLARLIAPV